MPLPATMPPTLPEKTPSAPAYMRKAAFAAHLGVSKSYISNLGKAGRLVTTEEGLVDVAATLALIRGTQGAPERAAVTSLEFADARDRKEHYLAEAARMDYEERCGRLFEAGPTVAAIADAATTLRTRLESLAEQLAAQVAPVSDEHACRTLIADHVETLLAEVAASFAGVARRATEAAHINAAAPRAH